METHETFFMNWAQDGSVPTVTFNDKTSAEYEARRLCEKTGKKIFTLCVHSSIEPAEKFVKKNYSYLPF